MKVLLIGTSDRRGGAAIASLRLFLALKRYYTDIFMLVREKFSSEPDVSGLTNNIFHKILNIARFIIERLYFAFYMKSKDLLFYFSPANTGMDISGLNIIRESDILHFHWINQGFISLRNLKSLLRSGKPVVWTIHDMWAFTGGCHYSGECENYITECGRCPFLRTNKRYDLSYRIFKKKEALFKAAQITFVAPSTWLADRARLSDLIDRFTTVVIPNPIDTEIFKPEDKYVIRKIKSLPEDKFLILAGSANLKDRRKGFKYLLDSLELLISQKPDMAGKVGLITFGKSEELTSLPYEVFNMSYMKDEKSVATLYQLADVYVLPSLEDNLPGTVMESLSCGTPVVAFNTGGIPDMIEHKNNGYLTETGNIEGLSEGILWIYEHQDISSISRNCREKVMQNYTYEIIAKKYYSLYQSLT